METTVRHSYPKVTLALASLAIVLVMSACASRKLKIEHTFDPELDFSSYSTFEVLPTKSIQDPDLAELLTDIVTSELTQRGLTETQDRGDLLLVIDLWTGSKEKMATSLGYAVETYNGVTTVYTVSREMDVGVLYVALVDHGSGAVAWKGSVMADLKDKMSPQARLDRLHRVVGQMLSAYPPPQE